MGINNKDTRFVKIRFGGDLMLGSQVLEKINKHGPTFPFDKIINEKKKSPHIFFVNLECTLSKNNHPPHPHKILLHSDPKIVEGLKKARINIVSLANNHSFDYGLTGFTETKNLLVNTAIKTVGGGMNINEASKSTEIKTNGIHLVFLAYCSKDSGCRHFATETDYGVADIEPKEIHRDIQKAKEYADVVIVSLHWGDEFMDYPNPGQVDMARRFIEKGATIVIGHHAHVFQGYEKHLNGLIIYDLGSFVFGDIIQKGYKFFLRKRKHKEGMMVECAVGKMGLMDLQFIPIYINDNFQVTLAKDLKGEKIRHRFYAQSKRIKTNNYQLFYKKYACKVSLLKSISKVCRIIRKMLHPQNWYRIGSRTIKKCFFSILYR
ncbi:MAG: CapA family protein [Desulfobacterium sp.]|nr:CapA family protein [Desulfobacterium sp.]